MRNNLLLAAMLFLLMAGNGFAFSIDFEDGVDGAAINDITGVSFTDFNGYNSIYGDSRTNAYNTASDDLDYGSGYYHHNGDFWLWAGTNADARGVIVDFTNNDGTWFKTGYSSYNNFSLDAYLTNGSMISVTGAANTGGPMDFLMINASVGLYLDYVVLHDSGNYWLVDDMSGDTSGINPVPEPGTLFLLGSGLFGLAIYRRKKAAK